MDNLAEKLNMQQLSFNSKDNKKLLYCQKINHKNESSEYSLLIFLHGAGERGNNNFSQLKDVDNIVKYLDESDKNVILIAPQCPQDHQWVDTPWGETAHNIHENPSEDLQMVIELVDSKINEFNIDKNKVYITGISMGGYGSWDFLARRPELFAGAVVICGGADLSTANRLENVALQIFHGSVDSVVPTVRSRNMYKALKDATHNNVQYTEYEGVDHNSWTQTYQNKEVLDWLFSQSK